MEKHTKSLNWVNDLASIGDKFYCIEKFSYAEMWHCELWSKEPEPWEDPIWDTIGTYEEVKKTAQEHYESQYRILPKN